MAIISTVYLYIFLVYLIFSRAILHMNTKQITEISQLVQSIKIMRYFNIPATVDLPTIYAQKPWESFICEDTLKVKTNVNKTWIYTTPVSLLLTKDSTSLRFQTMFSCFIRVFAHQRNVISGSSSLNQQSNSYSIQWRRNIVRTHKVYRRMRCIVLIYW